MALPWRDPRTSIFYLKRRIPARYRPVADQKGEQVKWSLETAERAEAMRRWPEALRRWDALVAEWEGRLSAEAVTPERAKEIAAGWAAWLASGETLDMGGEDDEVFAPWVDAALRTPDRMARMEARIAAHMQEALTLAGISITPETRPLLRREIALAAIHAYLQGPSAGIRVANPRRPLRSNFEAFRTMLPEVRQAPTMPTPPASRLSFASIFEAWKAVATVKPRTVEETRYILDNLKGFLRHDDAARVTREDVRRWRDASKADGLTNNTWNNRLSLVRQVFAQAVADERLPVNPADTSLRLKKNKAAPRSPYSDDDAKRILEAARRETKPTLRWAHWIMAFSGMRVGEVLQLLGRNVQRDAASGVWFMEVTEDDEGSTVKTGQKRHVPIHDALIREGFLAYAQGIAADAPLFPDKKADKFGMRGGRGWNAVGKWVRDTVGISDEAKVPNHSWRHRVEDELRAAEVYEADRDAIVGHARKTTGRHYGVRGEALGRLHRALSKIPCPVALPSGSTPAPEAAPVAG
jgi:integrase